MWVSSGYIIFCWKNPLELCIDQTKILTIRCAKSEQFFVASSQTTLNSWYLFPFESIRFFWSVSKNLSSLGALSEGEWTYHQHWRFAGLANGGLRDVVILKVFVFPFENEQREQGGLPLEKVDDAHRNPTIQLHRWLWFLDRLGLAWCFLGGLKVKELNSKMILLMTEIGLTHLIGSLFRMHRLCN